VAAAVAGVEPAAVVAVVQRAPAVVLQRLLLEAQADRAAVVVAVAVET